MSERAKPTGAAKRREALASSAQPSTFVAPRALAERAAERTSGVR
jgi:hypothetical protein